MTDDRFELLYELHSPVEAEILSDLLRENDVTVRRPASIDANLLGVGQNIIAYRIEVPVGQRDTASQVLQQFLQGDGEEHLREEGLLDDEED